MKRILYVMLSLGAVGAAAWLSVDIAHTIHERKTLERRIQTLPDLELTSLTGGRVDLRARSHRGTVIMYFTTTCPYCRDEIADFQAKRRLFVDATVILLSSEEVDGLRAFTDEIGLDSDFVVATDAMHAAAQHFGIRMVPTTFVYDTFGRLVRRFDGLAGAGTVAAALGLPALEPGFASALSSPERDSGIAVAPVHHERDSGLATAPRQPERDSENSETSND